MQTAQTIRRGGVLTLGVIAIPGNLRKKTGGKHSGRTEADYIKARRRVINSSSICTLCSAALDRTLKAVCRRVDTSGYTVENAHEIPLTCGEDCDRSHGRKPNPWSPSADHVVPVSKLLPGDPRLTDPRFMVAVHLVCNIRRGNRDEKPKSRTSKDWTA